MSKHIRAMMAGCLVVAAVVVAALVLTLPLAVLGIAYGGGDPFLVDLKQGAAHGYWIVGPLVTVYVIGRLALLVGGSMAGETMKRDPFRATIERRNAHEDKMWKRYAGKPAYTNWMMERFPDRIEAMAERNMKRRLKRIREARDEHG